jgi:hypothetical protein
VPPIFDGMINDLRYQRWASPESQAIEKFGRGWVPKDPDIQPMLPTDRKPRGRSPIQTQFKREDETRERDQEAWQMRVIGYSYPEISSIMGYACKQRAFDAVYRAQQERVYTRGKPAPAGTKDKLPDVKPPSRAAGRKGWLKCGCYATRHTRITIIGKERWCEVCAFAWYRSFNAGRTSRRSLPRPS